jgi:hypothetical protein
MQVGTDAPILLSWPQHAVLHHTEVVELPGAMADRASAAEAMAKAEALALRALAEELEHREAAPRTIKIAIPAAA